MRLWLAIRAFFAILFGRPLPPELAIEEPSAELPARTDDLERIDKIEDAKEALKPRPPPPPPISIPAEPDPKRLDAAAVQVLSLLQTEGRLLDFLSEDIEGYSDADIGAAVRDVHKGLRRALADHFPLSPVRSEAEESVLTVPEGFDPAQIRLTGNVIGKPPFSGRLKHRGWKVTAVRLPRLPSGDAALIVVPAEVEL